MTFLLAFVFLAVLAFFVSLFLQVARMESSLGKMVGQVEDFMIRRYKLRERRAKL